MNKRRTLNYVRQVKWSAAFKVVTTISTLASTSVLLNYLGADRYGIWSLIISLQSWVILFDLGIGKGLRNYVARSLSQNRISDSKSAIGSTYLIFGFICLGLAALILPLTFWVNWQAALNAPFLAEPELRLAVASGAIFALATLWVGIVNQICGALQRSALPAGFAALNTCVFALSAFCISRSGTVSVANVVILQGAISLASGLLLTVRVFSSRPDLRPRSFHIGPASGELIRTGGRFFAIQFCLLAIFATDRLLIAHLLDASQVSQYDVVFKIFALLTTIHLLIVGPLWSAYTEAFHRGEFDWIRKTLLTQGQIFVLLACAGLLLAMLVPWIVTIWIGDHLQVDMMLPYAMCLFAILLMWNNLFGALLNGIGALRAQLVASGLGAALNLPLSILFVRGLDTGVSGIVLATAASIAIQSLLMPVAAFAHVPLTARPLRADAWRGYLRKLTSWG